MSPNTSTTHSSSSEATPPAFPQEGPIRVYSFRAGARRGGSRKRKPGAGGGNTLSSIMSSRRRALDSKGFKTGGAATSRKRTAAAASSSSEEEGMEMSEAAPDSAIPLIPRSATPSPSPSSPSSPSSDSSGGRSDEEGEADGGDNRIIENVTGVQSGSASGGELVVEVVSEGAASLAAAATEGPPAKRLATATVNNGIKAAATTTTPSSALLPNKAEVVVKEEETKPLPASKVEEGKDSNKEDDKLLDLMQCPVCYEIPRRGPIYNCKNGHMVCPTCKGRMSTNNCPVCRSSPLDNRNLLAERLLEQRLRSDHTFRCQSHAAGCSFKLPLSRLLLHEDMCVFRTVPCPGRHRGACGWTGPLHDLIKHVVAQKCVQIVKMDETSGKYGSVIGDFNQADATVFGRGAMTHWKPVLLVSGAHMRLFAYLVICRDFRGEWSVSARSYCGGELLKNVRIKVTLKRPSEERARKEAAKWSKINSSNSGSSGSEQRQEERESSSSSGTKLEEIEDKGEEDDASYTYVGKLVSHDLGDKEAADMGEALVLRDCHVKRLRRDKTIFQYSAEIYEVLPPGQQSILKRPGFAATYGRGSEDGSILKRDK